MSNIELTFEQAQQVMVQSVKQRDFGQIYTGEMPTDEDKLMDIASDIVKYAIDEYVKLGSRQEEVLDILREAGRYDDEHGFLAVSESEKWALRDRPMTEIITNNGDKIKIPVDAIEALEAIGWRLPEEPDPPHGTDTGMEDEPDESWQEVEIEVDDGEKIREWMNSKPEEISGTVPVNSGPRPVREHADEIVIPDEEERVPLLTAREERVLALAEIEKSKLPIPREDISDPPDFPDDVSGVDDGMLASLHARFNSCLALANWKVALATVDHKAFRHIADGKMRDVRRELDPNDFKTGKAKAQDRLDREAEDDDRVRIWREKQFNAELRMVPLKALADIYAHHVETLSRQFTMRQREIESSGGLPRR